MTLLFPFSSVVSLYKDTKTSMNRDFKNALLTPYYRLNPRNRYWSQIHARKVLISIPGTLNPIHEAKFNPGADPYNLC